MTVLTKKLLEDIRNSITNNISAIETVRDECQEKFDDKTEEWQESPMGQALEGRIEDLSEVASGLEDILSSLNTIIENFNGEKK